MKKTHVEVASPEISVRHLADFMAASERKRRSIVEGCKYRPIARILQHKEATITIASALRKGVTAEALRDRAAFMRAKLATDDFDALTNETNADYVDRFSEVVAGVALPEAEILPGKRYDYPVNGVKVRFTPQLLLRRLTKTNKLKRGAVMFRYAKGKGLKPEIGCFQSAAAFGLLCEIADEEGAEPDRALCLTLDAYAGVLHPAPGASVSIFANMKAACESIAERWPNISPPAGAVL